MLESTSQIFFSGQVQTMKKGHPFEGTTASTPSKQTSDAEERTLTTQLGPN